MNCSSSEQTRARVATLGRAFRGREAGLGLRRRQCSAPRTAACRRAGAAEWLSSTNADCRRAGAAHRTMARNSSSIVLATEMLRSGRRVPSESRRRGTTCRSRSGRQCQPPAKVSRWVTPCATLTAAASSPYCSAPHPRHRTSATAGQFGSAQNRQNLVVGRDER